MKFLKIILLFLFLIANFFIFPIKSTAQIPGEGLTISPPIFELTLKPGETYSKTIKVTNPTEKLMEVYPLVMNFKAKGEGGEPAFYSATEEEAKFSLAHWIKFSQTKIALTPEQVVEFDYQITVPKDAEPGGHYGVIFFATEPPELEQDITQVAIASMIGSLVLVKVPGTIIEKGFLEEFSAKRFYFKPPVDFHIRIANLGNVHFKPQGDITVKNWQGEEVDKIAVNETKGNVLPDSTRKFEEKWERNGLILGRFSADLRVVYGEGEKTLDGKLIFWIIPWWSIASLVVIIVIITLTIWLIKRRRKSAQGGPASGGKRVKIGVDSLKR